MSLAVLVLLIIATQMLISKIGFSLSNIDGLGWSYISFEFTEEREKPMTTNVLVSIFLPNILMIFIYELYMKVGWSYIAKIIWIYVLGYYIYRSLLICVFLRRKELYAMKYEVSIAAVGTFISLAVCYGFLIKSESWFIEIDELREELWFALILLIYGLGKNILSNKLLQEDVLSQEKIRLYVCDKLKIFYKRYKDVARFKIKEPPVAVLILAIMIYEDYNRGPVKRFLEHVKIRFAGEATVSIMQVHSDKDIDDAAGIEVAYNKIISDYRSLRDEGYAWISVFDVAYKYNPDDTYASNVVYINEVVFDEIITNPDSYSDINLENYDCSDLSCLSKENVDNTDIIHLDIQPNVLKNITENENIRVKRTALGRGWELIIKNINDKEICLPAGEYITNQDDASVIRIDSCNNVLIKNIKINGQKLHENICCNGIYITNSNNVKFEDLEIYNCGGYGIRIDNGTLILKNSKLHNCSSGAIGGMDSAVEMEHCSITDCITTNEYLIDIDDLVMRNCLVKNNDVTYALFNDDNQNVFEDLIVEGNSFASSYLLQYDEYAICFKDNRIKGFA